MLDVGWQELFIIAVITIIVVGPKEIPTVLRTVMSWVRRIKEMAREFQTGIDDIARESELSEIRRELEETANVDLEKEFENTIDPDGELSSDMYDLQKASEEIAQQQEDLAQRQENLVTQQESFDAMRTELEAEEAVEAGSYSPPDEEAVDAIQSAKEDTVGSFDSDQSADSKPSTAPHRSS
jgi:sec-independent protein translocase protein TatB